MYKRLSLIFIFLLFLTSASGAFHHHDDGLIDDDCSVCITVSHNNSFVGYDNSNLLPIGFSGAQIFFHDDASLISSDTTASYSERAPPA